MKLRIVTTHPIQYQVPWFQRLAAHEGIDLKVYFATLPTPERRGIGFNRPVEWDIPLLDGYEWEELPNSVANPSLEPFRASSTPSIGKVLSADRPDAVIITGWSAWPLLQALRACIALGIPRLVRGESNAMRVRRWPVRLLHRRLLSRYDAFLTIGRANREFYLVNGVDESRLFATDYFVDNQRFHAQSQALIGDRQAIRAHWGIPDGHACHVFAGKLEKKKRVLDLIEAFSVAHRRNPSMHLLIVGTGDLMDDARRLAAECAAPITFTGFLNQTGISRAFVAADCLVLPSDFGETWGLVVNEAMASGLPAIVSDRVGCGPDLIEEGRTGSIFPFGDVGALAESLLRHADHGTLAEMGRRARERVAGYSVERAVEGTVEALAFLLDRPDRRSISFSPGTSPPRSAPG